MSLIGVGLSGVEGGEMGLVLDLARTCVRGGNVGQES